MKKIIKLAAVLLALVLSVYLVSTAISSKNDEVEIYCALMK